MIGERQNGMARVREGIQKIEAVGARFMVSFFYALLGECCALSDDKEEANRICQLALQFTQSGDVLGEGFWAAAMASTR